MGDATQSSEKQALFEITVRVHPKVFRDFMLSRDGAWGHFWSFLLPCLWLPACAILQMTLNDYFPELPLYALPLAVAYLAEYRRPGWAITGAILAGVVFDALTFGQLGVTSCILGLVAILVRYLCDAMDGMGKSLWERSLVHGCGAVFLYVACKLLLCAIMSNGSEALNLTPRHLLLGTLLGGVCVAPVLFSILDAMEWLGGIHRRPAKAVIGQQDGGAAVPAEKEARHEKEKQ